MADTSQPTVFDYATGTQWRLAFNRIPKTTWFCTAANLPGISLGEATFPTPIHDIYLTGDKLTFENLNITFIVDEELQNYRELWDWLVGMGTPKSQSQWLPELKKGDSSVKRKGRSYEESNFYSDATLIIYNSKNIPKVEVKFKDMFPTSLSALDYSQELSDIEYFKASATFRYMYYEFETSK